MLEADDIQHILLTRAPALTGRYEFLSFRDPAGGRAWLSAIKDTVQSAAAMRASVDKDKRWVTVAFTWNGLRALGLDEASLSSFPDEFKQGMAARAEALAAQGKVAEAVAAAKEVEADDGARRARLVLGELLLRQLRHGRWGQGDGQYLRRAGWSADPAGGPDGDHHRDVGD